MTRRLLILFAVILIGIGAASISRSFFQVPTSEWLLNRYSLNSQQAEHIRSLQNEYQTTCKVLCDDMCKANDELQNQIVTAESLTPAISEAVEKSDRIRTAARISMLKHCFAIAAELPQEQRREYLKKMTPLAIDPRCCDDK